MTNEKLKELLKIAYHWGRDNGLNRSDKNFNCLLQTEAINQALSLGAVGKSFAVGENLKVVRCINGHEFEVGQIVRIVETDTRQTTLYLCSDGRKKWWLSEYEANVC